VTTAYKPPVNNVLQQQLLLFTSRSIVGIALVICRIVKTNADVLGIDVSEVGSPYLPTAYAIRLRLASWDRFGAVELERWWKETLGLLRGSSHSTFISRTRPSFVPCAASVNERLLYVHDL
jgi:hypothetical protein